MPGSEPLWQATRDDGPALLRLVAAFHQGHAIALPETARAAALDRLLGDQAIGAAWCAGPRNAPLGYAVICHVLSLEFGGTAGVLDELYVCPAARGRGLGGQLVGAVTRHADRTGLCAIFLEVEARDSGLARLYARHGFDARTRYAQMLRPGPQLPTG